MRLTRQQLDDGFELSARATWAGIIIVGTVIAVVNLPAIVRFLGI